MEKATIKDRCSAIGAAYMMQKAFNPLEQYVKAAACYFDFDDDADHAAFLANVATALDYCAIIKNMTESIEESLKAMRADVSPIFDTDN